MFNLPSVGPPRLCYIRQKRVRFRIFRLEAGPRFNIKMSSCRYRKSHLEIRGSWDRLISTMGFLILVRCHLYNEAGPRPESCSRWHSCNGGYFSETSLRPKIRPARPRDPVIHIKPQAPKARGCRCLIRIQVLVSSQKQGAVSQPRATA